MTLILAPTTCLGLTSVINLSTSPCSYLSYRTSNPLSISPDSSLISALLSTQWHQMIKKKRKKKLQHLSAPELLIHWADSFLSNRPQSHQRGQHHLLITNTGVSQGCVLSPSLFTHNTNGCSSPSPSQKYSDGTEGVALLKNNTSGIDCQSFIPHLTQWCTDNHPVVVFKSSGRTAPNITHNPVNIAGEVSGRTQRSLREQTLLD